MVENGISVERQVELISDVVHNHSNDIDEIKYSLINQWKPWSVDVVDHINDCAGNIKKICDRLDNIESDMAGSGVKKFFGMIGLGIVGYFGYKYLANIREDVDNLKSKQLVRDTEEAVEVAEKKMDN